MIDKNAFTKLEIIWWILTIVLAVGLLLPIVLANSTYKFTIQTFMNIVVLVTAARYIFFIKYTFIANHKILKAAIIILIIPFIFFLVGRLNSFLDFTENIGLQEEFSMLTNNQSRISEYAHHLMIFVSVGAIISCLALSIRLLISIWRNINKGTS